MSSVRDIHSNPKLKPAEEANPAYCVIARSEIQLNSIAVDVATGLFTLVAPHLIEMVLSSIRVAWTQERALSETKRRLFGAWANCDFVIPWWKDEPRLFVERRAQIVLRY